MGQFLVAIVMLVVFSLLDKFLNYIDGGSAWQATKIFKILLILYVVGSGLKACGIL